MRAELGGECRPDESSFIKYMASNNMDDLESTINLNNTYLHSKKAIEHDFETQHRTLYGNVANNTLANETYKNIATLVHEYGHSILAGKLNEIHLENGGTNPTYVAARRMYRMYIRKLREIERQIQDVRDSYAGQVDGLKKGIEAAKELQAQYDELCVSKYSKESVGEFIAECFADVELSDNPKTISKQVYKLLVEQCGKAKKQ